MTLNHLRFSITILSRTIPGDIEALYEGDTNTSQVDDQMIHFNLHVGQRRKLPEAMQVVQPIWVGLLIERVHLFEDGVIVVVDTMRAKPSRV